MKQPKPSYIFWGVIFAVWNVVAVATLESNKYLSTFSFGKNVNTLLFRRFDDIPRITENDKTYFSSVGISLSPPEYEAPSADKRKNVVIIFLESFDRALVEVKIPEFGYIAPNINKFKKEAIYYRKFVGATQFTIRGVAAILCGVFADIEVDTYAENSTMRSFSKKVHCLSDILNKNGYESVYITGETLPFYAHMDILFRLHGYRIIPSTDYVTQEIIDKKENAINFFGVSDYHVANGAISELENLSKKETPFNLTTFFLGTHGPWHDYPECPETALNDRFARSVYCVDYAFNMIWQYIKTHPKLSKNTVIALVADHSTPQKISKYSEYIVPHYDKTITWMIYDPETTAYVNDNMTYHPDFSPTLLGLMNFKIHQMYMGHNVTKEGRKNKYYVSPYITIEDNQIKITSKQFGQILCDKDKKYLLEEHQFVDGRLNECDRKKMYLLIKRWLMN